MPPPVSAAAAIALLIAGVSMVVPSPLAPKRRTLNEGVSLSDLVPLSVPADGRLKAPTVAADAAPVSPIFKNFLRCACPSSAMAKSSPGNFGYQSNSLLHFRAGRDDFRREVASL